MCCVRDCNIVCVACVGTETQIAVLICMPYSTDSSAYQSHVICKSYWCFGGKNDADIPNYDTTNVDFPRDRFFCSVYST